MRKEYDILVDELRRYNPELMDKQSIVAISKSDLLDEELRAEMTDLLDESFGDIPHLFISSVAQQGLDVLKDRLWEVLNAPAL